MLYKWKCFSKLLSGTQRTFLRSTAVWSGNEYKSKQKIFMQLMLYSYLNSYLDVYPGKAYILIVLQWALQWKPGSSIKWYIPIPSLQIFFFSKKLVFSLYFFLWTHAFIHNLCELGHTWGSCSLIVSCAIIFISSCRQLIKCAEL